MELGNLLEWTADISVNWSGGYTHRAESKALWSVGRAGAAVDLKIYILIFIGPSVPKISKSENSPKQSATKTGIIWHVCVKCLPLCERTF